MEEKQESVFFPNTRGKLCIVKSKGLRRRGSAGDVGEKRCKRANQTAKGRRKDQGHTGCILEAKLMRG